MNTNHIPAKLGLHILRTLSTEHINMLETPTFK